MNGWVLFSIGLAIIYFIITFFNTIFRSTEELKLTPIDLAWCMLIIVTLFIGLLE